MEFECLVLEIVDSEAFIAIPGTANQSSSGEWVEATASVEEQQPLDGQVLTVSSWEPPILLQRVLRGLCICLAFCAPGAGDSSRQQMEAWRGHRSGVAWQFSMAASNGTLLCPSPIPAFG